MHISYLIAELANAVGGGPDVSHTQRAAYFPNSFTPAH